MIDMGEALLRRAISKTNPGRTFRLQLMGRSTEGNFSFPIGRQTVSFCWGDR